MPAVPAVSREPETTLRHITTHTTPATGLRSVGDTSWRYAADYLDMAGTVERAMMFGAAELALFATALMARQNLNSQGAPGLPGNLVWVITGVQIIPAYAESGPVGGTVRAFVGPVMAAMLWHLAMGIELRLHKPDATSTGLLATLGSEARERLLSRLGIAARDRDAAQITRDRATTRAVTLAARLSDHTPAQRQKWRGRRLTRKLSKALGRAAVGTDPAQRSQLLDQLAARRHAHTLATVPLAATLTDAEAAGHQPATLLAEATRRRELDTADSVSDVLVWRLRRLADLPADAEQFPVTGTVPAPSRTPPIHRAGAHSDQPSRRGR